MRTLFSRRLSRHNPLVLLSVVLLALLAGCAGGDDPVREPRAGWYVEPASWTWTGAALDTALGPHGPWVPLQAPAHALALLVDGPLDERAWYVTARGDDGRELPAVAVEWTWHEGEAHVGRVALPTPAVAVRLQGAGATMVQVEVLGQVPDWSGPLTASLPLASDEPMPKYTLPSWVVSRASWGARSTPVCGSAHTPSYLTVHHTATPNDDALSPAARMRQMQAYHIDALGWCDFGYHFTVGIDGRVYQGRTLATRTGSHVGDHNTNNVGVSVVGNFVSFDPRAVQVDGLVQIGTWITATWGIPRSRDRILGHRDWSGHRSNACPGDRLYAQLGSIVSRMGGSAPPACPDVCTAGATRCGGDGRVERCADHSGDGCPTWGGAVECGCGQTCEGAGVCVADRSVCCPSAVAGSTGVFADLPDGSPGVRIAEQLFEQGITSGCSASPRLFCPDCWISRAQAAAFVAAALELPTPVPAAARFVDVPTSHPQAGAIEALAAAGILAGCSAEPPRFCPDDTLSRAQAAQLVVRAAGDEIAASSRVVFDDVPGDAWYRPAVETLHRGCVVSGCSTEPLRYCPDRAVTRLEFGTLLLKGLGLDADATGTPCCRPEPVAGASGVFGDVADGDPFAPLAQVWFDAGITAGCQAEPRLFCRDCGVTRGQGMSLLARAMALELAAPAVAPFADVPAEHPDAAAIAALVGRGIVEGCDVERGLFCPDSFLSRAQTAALLTRVLGVDGDGAPAPGLVDVPSDAWYRPAVATILDACIGEPCDDDGTRFCAGDPIRREDFAWWVSRALRIGGLTNCAAPPDGDDGSPDPADPDAGVVPDAGDAGDGDSGAGDADGDAAIDAAEVGDLDASDTGAVEDAGSGDAADVMLSPDAPNVGDVERVDAPEHGGAAARSGGCASATGGVGLWWWLLAVASVKRTRRSSVRGGTAVSGGSGSDPERSAGEE